MAEPTKPKRRVTQYQVTWEKPKSGNGKPKLKLPAPPAYDDIRGQCAWLTAVFNLDPAHPITLGKWYGLQSGAGQIVLERGDARSISIEPASAILTPNKFMERLMFTRIATDAEPYSYEGHHCRTISHVIYQLCDSSKAITEVDEILAVVDSFISDARRLDGFTLYGSTAQRYELLEALQRDAGRRAHNLEPWEYRYAVDLIKSEYIVASDELRASARRQFGSAMGRGWFEGRMEKIGWQCVRLSARPQGRGSRQLDRYIWRGELADD